MDFTDLQALQRAMAHVEGMWGRLDILLHCAADIPFGFVENVSEEALDTTFNSILKSSFWLAGEALPSLKKAIDGGRLVFISSIAGNRMVVPGWVHYGAAKA